MILNSKEIFDFFLSINYTFRSKLILMAINADNRSILNKKTERIISVLIDYQIFAITT